EPRAASRHHARTGGNPAAGRNGRNPVTCYPRMLRSELIALMLMLACSHSSQPAPESRSLTGTVAYRERIALPSDAVIQVQLSDVSVEDVAAPVVAETPVTPKGRQVPLPFELHYDVGKIDPKRIYAVRATTRTQEQLLFPTTTATPVLTQGN